MKPKPKNYEYVKQLIQRIKELEERTELAEAMRDVAFNRVWAMPSADTFDVKPMGDFVRKYLNKANISVDPFARNKRWATHTNDLNPETSAENHLHALEFLTMLKEKDVLADLVIFDPPYSPHQTKTCYNGFGISMKYEDDARHGWHKTRQAIADIQAEGGICLSFGWNTVGIGKKKGYEIMEILLVCHGIGHNDTICLAERKRIAQPRGCSPMIYNL